MQKVAHRYGLRSRAWIGALAIGAFAVAACYLPDPCNDNEVYIRDHHSCVVPTSTTATDGPDTGSGGDDNPDPAACDDTQFGRECATNDDCACDTDFCAVQPGQPTGFCTITGCLDAPESCGQGFFCLDISTVSPTVGSLCVPE